MSEPQSDELTNFSTTAICSIILSHLGLKVKLYNKIMIEIQDKRYEVVIEKKRIKNIYLRVKDNTIYATCPYYTKDYEVYNFIETKKKWIYNLSKRKTDNSKLVVGKTIFFRGKEYRFVVLNGPKAMKIEEDVIYIRCKSGEIEEALKVFYEYGKKLIKQYVLDNEEKYLTVLREYGYYKKPEYNVKYLKSMWGCCYSQKNIINLSVRLIHFEDKCLDAILWHELLHFIIPNHSKRYHQVIDAHMPEYNKIISTLH